MGVRLRVLVGSENTLIPFGYDTKIKKGINDGSIEILYTPNREVSLSEIIEDIVLPKTTIFNPLKLTYSDFN